MKKPIYNQLERMIMRDFPDSSISVRRIAWIEMVRSTRAWMRSYIEPICVVGEKHPVIFSIVVYGIAALMVLYMFLDIMKK